MLDASEPDVTGALAARIEALNEEIRRLRDQQRFIAAVLGRSDQLEKLAFMSRERFVSALIAGGFTEEEMDRWHAAFERTSPEEHQRFLEFLCIPDREIRAIRDWSARPRRPQPHFPPRS